MRFIESVFEKLKRHPKRIVFPEGAEPRVLEAAGRFNRMQLGAPILLGDINEIKRKADQYRVDLTRIGIVDPAKADDLEIFASRLERLQRYRNIGAGDPREILRNPNYFAAMMIQHGQADALVGGASQYASSLMRPLIQIIKPLPGITTVSSCMMMEGVPKQFGTDGMIMFADCAVVPEPTVEQLASIGIETAKVCRQLTGARPRVAFLSFSTKGSSRLPAASKMAAAAALTRQRADAEKVELDVDGELQADTALLPELAALKAPTSRVAGGANVLIFPDLSSGNIAAKLVQHLGGATAYGQVLLGLSRPAADMSRGASADDILGVAAIVGLQAIEYRKLYPQTEEELAEV
jgi:phosphate acetyltransferase